MPKLKSGPLPCRHSSEAERGPAGIHAKAAGVALSPYYTLASASLLLAELPVSTGKKLSRYPTEPAVSMGRLAVDQGFRWQGLGSTLLADAPGRAVRSEVAAFALVVDPKTMRRLLSTGIMALSLCPIHREPCFCHCQATSRSAGRGRYERLKGSKPIKSANISTLK